MDILPVFVIVIRGGGSGFVFVDGTKGVPKGQVRKKRRVGRYKCKLKGDIMIGDMFRSVFALTR